MNTVQNICLFLSGYLASRVILKINAHRTLISWILTKSKGQWSYLILGIMLATFALSLFVPNALTVLAMLPIIELCIESADSADRRLNKHVTTTFILALIYGANIGGMGSLLGSPANLYLLLNLQIFAVPGRQSIHFVSWLAFGLPMGLVFLGIAWILLVTFQKKRLSRLGRIASPTCDDTSQPIYRVGMWSVYLLGLFWLLMLLGQGFLGMPDNVLCFMMGWQVIGLSILDLLSVAFTVVHTVILFVLPFKAGQSRHPLLTITDLFHKLPWRGLLLAFAVVGVLYGLAQSGVISYLEEPLTHIFPRSLHLLWTNLILGLITIYSTEFLNNTTVATALFPLSIAIAAHTGTSALILMTTVSVASTCAFMTPLATPVNALAFGGQKGVSLTTMIRIGAVLNLLGGIWIALWMTFVAPTLIGWFGTTG